MHNVFSRKQEALKQYDQNHKYLSENRGSLRGTVIPSKVEDKSYKIHFFICIHISSDNQKIQQRVQKRVLSSETHSHGSSHVCNCLILKKIKINPPPNSHY